MAMSTLQKRIAFNGAVCGSVLALLVTIVDLLGWFAPLEAWLYDYRAASCQNFTPKPSADIVYLDIDDDSLDTIQRWPWDRSRMAAVLNELRLANPKVVMLDIIFSEAQADRIERTPDGQYVTVEEDPALARAIDELGSVVLASSLRPQPVADDIVRLRAKAADLIATDVTTDRAALVDRLKLPAAEKKELQEHIENDFAGIRRDGIRKAIHAAFKSGVDQLKDIERRLVPFETGADAPPLQYRTQVDIIRQEYQRVLSERYLQRSIIPRPPHAGTMPADAVYTAIPLPILCNTMFGTGYVDHRMFKDPVVRSVPLFLQVEEGYFPQMALVTACKLLDADLHAARFADDAVTIPSPSGDIRIPVRAPYSETMRRDVGYVMDIPWYGTQRWEEMNDWPAHQTSAQRYAIDSVWSVVEVQRRLDANNAVLDDCLKFFYDLDPSFKHDTPDRSTAVARVKKDLADFGYDAIFQTDPTTRSDAEKLIVKFMTALRNASEQNVGLEAELKQHRAQMTRRFAGKAVLVGATASATGDVVSTSLHTTCPGVVVHGVIMNAIVNRDFLTAAPRWFNIGLVVTLGLIATFVTSFLPPARALLLLFLIGALYFVVNGIVFYDKLNWVVDVGAPLVVIFVCWGGVMLVRAIVEILERIRLNKEAALIDHEIELARQVQSALIPKELQLLDPVDSHGWTKAATTTGGDCFDLWRLKDGRMGILVADASGHGLGPSIVVSQVRALIRSMCDLYDKPQDLLNAVNTRMAEDLGGRKFCTCFLGYLSADGKLAWGSAGHGPMLWSPTRDGKIEELNGTSLPLGISEDPFAEESIPILELKPGGWLAVISDGIFEAANPQGDQFGVERINQAILPTLEQPSERVVDALRRSVDVWQAKPIPDDDQTIVFLTFKTDRPAAATNPTTDNT